MGILRKYSQLRKSPAGNFSTIKVTGYSSETGIQALSGIFI
jgi:hypothetical protein